MTKTITMSYDLYLDELKEAKGNEFKHVLKIEKSKAEGFEEALNMVKEYLESNKSFNRWYWKGRDAADTPHPYWLDILVALDREEEWSE